jgi:hypothetical protein
MLLCGGRIRWRHQALPAGQDAPAIGSYLSELRDGLVDCIRAVIDERGGLHRSWIELGREIRVAN